MKRKNVKNLFNQTNRLLKIVAQSSKFRTALLAAFIISIWAVPALAQLDGGSDSGVEDSARNLFNIIYSNWRIPFTALGLGYAAFVAYTDNLNGTGRALKIVAITAAVALIPSVLRFIAKFTNTPFS